MEWKRESPIIADFPTRQKICVLEVNCLNGLGERIAKNSYYEVFAYLVLNQVYSATSIALAQRVAEIGEEEANGISPKRGELVALFHLNHIYMKASENYRTMLANNYRAAMEMSLGEKEDKALRDKMIALYASEAVWTVPEMIDRIGDANENTLRPKVRIHEKKGLLRKVKTPSEFMGFGGFLKRTSGRIPELYLPIDFWYIAYGAGHVKGYEVETQSVSSIDDFRRDVVDLGKAHDFQASRLIAKLFRKWEEKPDAILLQLFREIASNKKSLPYYIKKEGDRVYPLFPFKAKIITQIEK